MEIAIVMKIVAFIVMLVKGKMMGMDRVKALLLASKAVNVYLRPPNVM